MLEEIESTHHEGLIFRLVNQARHVEFLRGIGLDVDQTEEMLTFLRQRGIGDDPVDVLNSPFADKPLLKAIQTRFSDGTLRVFYSATEPQTAEQEVRYWYVKPALEARRTPVRMYYRLAACDFFGDVKDLRPKVNDWPFLTANDGYDSCNEIGKEAASSGLTGLLSQSARRPEGTTLPVFARSALTGVQLQDYRVLSYDPATGNVTISVA